MTNSEGMPMSNGGWRHLPRSSLVIRASSFRETGIGHWPFRATRVHHLSFQIAGAFTIIELIVVIGIILVLAGLILATNGYVHNKGARSRAEAEIAAISAALENYKADNGVYVTQIGVNAKTQGNPASYQAASLILYQNLTGDFDKNRSPDSGKPSYVTLKPNQLSPSDQSSEVAFIKDPFGNSYGYSTINATDPSKGYNPTYDLWSTAGTVDTSSSPNSSSWVKNW
jgi:type II secretory pathway pseudopilin PulG